jgi:hypothetical protein
MWCTSLKLMPRCPLICLRVTWRSHGTIWTTLAHVSGPVLSGVWPGGAKSVYDQAVPSWCMTRRCQVLQPAPTLFEPLGPVKHCCRLQTVIAIHVNVRWSCTFHTEIDVAALCVFALIHDCPAQNNLQLCTDNTEQPAHDRCLSRLVVTTVWQNKND